jgi:signal transduction histidine kinase
VLPQIENASITEIVKRVVEAHQQKTNTTVDTTIDEDDPELAPALKICIYRFIQEALNNAYRHGGGVDQAVMATSHDGHVRIEVRDRGEGFDPTQVRSASLGLVGLRERIDSLGGEFDIKTGEGGTTVIMTFEPMEAEE